MSETNAPASTFTSITAPGNDSLTLADKVKKYDTTGLISFLQERVLGLDEDDLEIIRNEKINGWAFLKTTKQRFSRIWPEVGTCEEACGICQGM